MKLLLIFIGGGLGSITRYLLGSVFFDAQSMTFPWHTFIINVLGALALGLIVGFSEKSGQYTGNLLFFAGVGFCGGFTTFSTFSYENYTLIKSNMIFLSMTYTIASVIGGIIAAYLGYTASK